MKLLQANQQALNIGLLLLPESSLMTLASVLDVMRAANRVAQRPLFHWQIATVDGKAATLSCGLTIEADLALSDPLSGDILFMIGGFHQERHINKQQLHSLHQMMNRFQVLAGIESGSWLLARSGRLDGRQATTHWEDLEEFAFRFPQIQVKPDRFVIDGNILTAGGASPCFDLMLHLISQRYGQPLALEVASVFIYDANHSATDAQPLVSLGLLEMREPRVGKAIRLMEMHIEEPLKLIELAQRLSLSLRTLAYLFQQHLKQTPQQYYLRLRLQHARRLVTDTHLPIQDIALRAGFTSLAVFSRRFKHHYQLSPLQYRRRLMAAEVPRV